MAEPATLESRSTPSGEEQSSRARWLRLLRSVFWFGSFVALVSFATDVYGYVRGDQLDLGGTTGDLALDWLTKALAEGLFMGFLMAFPMWLAREEFPPPKRKQRNRRNA